MSAPRLGLGQCDLPVQLERLVVEHLATVVEQPAVAVAGVLVEAQVGHEHHPVADRVAQSAQRHLHDALRVPGSRPPLVLLGGHTEEDDTGDAEVGQRRDLGLERLEGVLHHAGDRRDGHGLVDALADEERGDEVVHRQAGLRDESPQGGRAAEPAQAALGEAHRRPA